MLLLISTTLYKKLRIRKMQCHNNASTSICGVVIKYEFEATMALRSLYRNHYQFKWSI